MQREEGADGLVLGWLAANKMADGKIPSISNLCMIRNLKYGIRNSNMKISIMYVSEEVGGRGGW